ncbi:ABC transporter ced-7 [Diplonema papillatum]|nr:ABC transporter ced-7 [Diplonema papillatum]
MKSNQSSPAKGSSFMAQVATVTKKNFKLKMRAPVGWCVEMSLPALLMACLIPAWQAGSISEQPQRRFAGDVVLDIPGAMDAYKCYKNPSRCVENPASCISPATGQPYCLCPNPPADMPCVGDLCLDTTGQALVMFDAAMSEPAPIVPPDFDTMVLVHKAGKMGLIGTANGFQASRSVSYSVGYRVAVVGASNDAAVQGFVQDLRQFFNTSTHTFSEAYVHFSSEDDLENWVVDAGHQQLMIGIVIEGEHSYKLRVNRTASPNTRRGTPLGDPSGLPDVYSTYYTSSFISTQRLVDQFWLQRLSGANATAPSLADLVSFPFPYASYTEDEFLQMAGPFLALVVVISFLYFVSQFVSTIVKEKEDRIKEAMLAMGLRSSALRWSYCLLGFFEAVVISVLLTTVVAVSYFSRSDWMLMFLLSFFYGMSVVTFSGLLATFFSKAQLAGLGSPFIFLLIAVPKFVLPDDVSLSFLMLFSTHAYAEGFDTVSVLETGGEGLTAGTINKGDVPVSLVLFFLVFDTVLYALLEWYLSLVLPSEWGTQLHPCFCFVSKKPDALTPPRATSEAERARIEAPSETRPPVVAVSNLCKVFPTDDGVVTAVDNLSLDMHEDKILVLLGHNGAGKTTTINMLTGMLTVSSGEARVYGIDVVKSMSAIRKDLGLCPQHNILWPHLTCREHLCFFGRLRGLTGAELDEAAKTMLAEVGLADKIDEESSSLSGGMKRKLSVAIALIGGPRLVIMDEPTAGMDIQARRLIWDLIKRSKKGRTILLTTHFMDEADLLGDSIAIMHAGRLHSWGSSFFLKSTLGIGYTLKLEVNDTCAPKEVLSVINEGLTRFGNATAPDTQELHGNTESLVAQRGGSTSNLTSVADTEDETTPVLQLLEAEPHNLPAVNPLSRPAFEPAAVRRVSPPVKSPRTSGTLQLAEIVSSAARELAIRLPMQAMAVFPLVFKAIETRQETLGIIAFGVSVTTLEEIFIRIAQGGSDEKVEEQRQDKTDKANCQDDNEIEPADAKIDAEDRHTDDLDTSAFTVPLADRIVDKKALLVQQLRAGLYKRFSVGRRDKRTLCYQILLPLTIIAMAFAMLLIPIPDQPARDIIPDDSSEVIIGTATGIPGDGLPYSYTTQGIVSWMGLETVLFDEMSRHAADRRVGLVDAVSQRPFSVKVLCSAVGNRSLSQFEQYALARTSFNVTHLTLPGAFLPRDTKAALFNGSYLHALPLSVLVQDSLMLQRLTGDSSSHFKVTNHPLPNSRLLETRIQGWRTTTIGLFVLIPFTMVPSTYVSFIVREKQSQSKHVQLVAGCSLASFWLSSFIWDLLSYACTTAIAMLMFLAFDREEYVGNAENFFATVLLLILYGISSIGAAYLVSFYFDSYTAAQSVVSSVCLFSGFVLVLTANILSSIESTASVAVVLRHIFRIVPAFCVGDGIIQLALRPSLEVYGLEDEGAFAMDVTGWNMLWMALEAPLLYVLVVIHDFPELLYLIGIRKASDEGKEATVLEDEDEDTVEEAALVDGLDAANDEKYAVVVKRLHKKFASHGSDDFVAVKSVSFAVQKGEVFCLLGTNGAGKTTTLSMLAGQVQPTAGTSFLGGYNVASDTSRARTQLGYCPQFDALLDLMTPLEHLRFYCALRGIPNDKVDRVCTAILRRLDLEPHQHKECRKLSGGNKRKLSIGISLVGGPLALLLDEPTAGMDPVARRGMWNALKEIGSDRSVILTTHHLEEVEALAHRVAIMVAGRVECIGSLPHLKEKFGGGYEVEIKAANTDSIAKVIAFMRQRFRCEIVEEAGERITFRLEKGACKLSEIFGAVEAERSQSTIVDYSISQTSLDQVFMSICRRWEDVLEQLDNIKTQHGPATAEAILASDCKLREAHRRSFVVESTASSSTRSHTAM